MKVARKLSFKFGYKHKPRMICQKMKQQKKHLKSRKKYWKSAKRNGTEMTGSLLNICGGK